MRFSLRTIALLMDKGIAGDDLVDLLRRIEADFEAANRAPPPRFVRAAANDERVWVYVIAEDYPDSTLTKVGISQHPEHRLHTLQREQGRNLYIAHTHGPVSRTEALDIERRTHQSLSDLRLHGEWFDCTTSLAKRALQLAVDGEDQ